MKKTSVFISLLIAVILTGCHSNRQVFQPVNDSWEKAVIPFKLHIEGNISPSGKAYFVKDQSILLSMRYLGMEVMTIYADNDSIFLYDKFDGVLVGERLGKDPITGKRLNANRLQQLLTGPVNIDGSLKLENNTMEIALSPVIDTSSLIRSVTRWDASVINRRTGKTLKADLTWDYGSADWNPANIPVWKKPLKPKKIVALHDLLIILSNQF